MYSPHHSVARAMTVTACTSLVTAMLASLGLFVTKRAKDFQDIILAVDTLALMSSITTAVVSTRRIDPVELLKDADVYG